MAAALIRSIDREAGTISLDRIQVFMGPEAESEAAKDGQPEPPDGIYVRNAVRQDFELELSEDCVVVVYAQNVPEGVPLVEDARSTPIAVLDRSGFFDAYPGWLEETLDWIGVVVTLSEGEGVFMHGNYAP